jgi:hypothetical protein
MRVLLTLFVAGLATASHAQYREDSSAAAGLYRDGPEVLSAAPPPPPPGIVAAGNFRAVYGRVGRPRMLVFWNRTFSDEVTSNYRDNLRAEATTNSSANGSTVARRGWNTSSVGSAAESSGRSTLDVSTGTDRVDQGRYNPLGEDVDFAVEAAFSETLAANGAQLIDRSLAMRTARGAKGPGSRPNMQAIETEAATGRADLLVEVLQTPAPGTPTGASFKVTVKNIRQARVLAAFTTSGRQPHVKQPLVAGPGGFVRASAPGTSPSGVGRELANQTMAALARSLR